MVVLVLPDHERVRVLAHCLPALSSLHALLRVSAVGGVSR